MSSTTETTNINDFSNICRTCMLHCDVKFYRDNLISNVYHKLSDINFEVNDELPQQVCLKCFEKINEFHEFAFQCKRTYSALIKRLKNFKKIGLNEEQNITINPNVRKKYELVIKLENNIIDKPKIEKVEDENSNTDTDYKNYNEENQNILENTNNETNEDVITDKSQIYNFSEDHEFISIKSNIEENKEECKNNAVLDELNVNTLKNSEETNKKVEEDKHYKCDNCNKIFTYLKPYEKHVNFLKCKPFFDCKQCSKSFTRLINLQLHMRSHTVNRSFKKSPNSKSSPQSSTLKNCRKYKKKCDNPVKSENIMPQLLMHNGKFQYKCKQCSKTFTKMYSLKLHVRLHDDELPNKCKICAKTFAHLSSLKSHMRTHSGEQPFKCKLCSRRFAHSNNMRIHLRTHSGERPYKCKLCSKTYITSSNLRMHMKKHNCERFS